jgi:hypothetical protein
MQKKTAWQRVAEAGNGKEAITKRVTGRDLAETLDNLLDNRPAGHKLEEEITSEPQA